MQAVNRHHLIGSMEIVDAAGYNAAMECFFALMQARVLDRKRWRTQEELRIAIITRIERAYYRRARLGRLTPIEYVSIMNPTASLAAQLQLTPDRAAAPETRSAAVNVSQKLTLRFISPILL